MWSRQWGVAMRLGVFVILGVAYFYRHAQDRGSRDVEVFVGDNGHSLTAAAELLKGKSMYYCIIMTVYYYMTTHV